MARYFVLSRASNDDCYSTEHASDYNLTGYVTYDAAATDAMKVHNDPKRDRRHTDVIIVQVVGKLVPPRTATVERLVP